MCLIHFHLRKHSNYKFIITANRDEFYNRPTEQAHFWPDAPFVLDGRDMLKKGTWLGITRNGRFCALTNIRNLPMDDTGKKSRGDIVSDFLTTHDTPLHFLEKLRRQRDVYPGFNLIFGNQEELFHYNNVRDEWIKVSPGTHSLSNDTLNTPWPKVKDGRIRLHRYVTQSKEINTDTLFEIMEDKKIAPDYLLPKTGLELELEQQLSASFIITPNYGTRSSTVILIDKHNQVTFFERTYAKGNMEKELKFNFRIE